MTRYDAIRRQLGDIEKHEERALAKHEMQVNLLCAYRDQLEDEVDIAVGIIAMANGWSKDDALALIAGEYEMRQELKAAATL